MGSVTTILFLLVTYFSFGFMLPQPIKIGGLFVGGDVWEEIAFHHAAERFNMDQTAFPSFSLTPLGANVLTGDSYNASVKACELLREGIVGLVGPHSPITASAVQAISEVFAIPHIETVWDFRRASGDFLVNLYPEPTMLSQAYADVIADFAWSKVVILYENNESLVRLQQIFDLTGTIITEFIVKQLPSHNDFRPLMKDLRTNYHEITHLIVDCQSSKLGKLFQDAASENLTTFNHKYFLTSLDIEILDPQNSAFSDANITAFRLVDPANARLQVILESLKFNVAKYRSDRHIIRQPELMVPQLKNDLVLLSETVLMYDALQLFALALKQEFTPSIGRRSPPNLRPDHSLNCDSTSPYPWSQGPTLMRAIKETTFEGLSGFIEFDSNGKRTNFRLEVMELTTNSISQIGNWQGVPSHSGKRLNWIRSENDTLSRQIKDLEGKELIVTTKESEPYSVYKPGGPGDGFDGFAIELMRKLAAEFKFKPKFVLVKDGLMGLPTKNTSYKYGWTGLVGEILSGPAELAIGDMSITSDRAAVIDFSLPFMNLGIGIMYMRPAKTPPKLFSFLDPFHYEVWIYMATAYLGVSLILFVLARIEDGEWQVSSGGPSGDTEEVLENQFDLINTYWMITGSALGAGSDVLPKITPFEWLNPHPCVESPDELELTLHLTNSLWFSIGTLMQQGSDIAPKAGSTRVVAGIWWFFTLILISSYTANLAAFLTSEGMVEGIKDIKDLPKQTKVTYGTLKSGSTNQFFKDSTFPLYKEIGKNMAAMSPDPHTADVRKGVDKVISMNGTYAFFMESVSIEYYKQQDCRLVQLGTPLDSKGYGIGFRKGSKFRNAFNEMLLKFAQNGELEDLKKRYWVQKCPVEASVVSGATALSLLHVGGVFVVLSVGCVMAIIMAFFEVLWKGRKLAKDNQTGVWHETWNELKFALQLQHETKPIRKSMTSLNPTAIGESGSLPYKRFDGDQNNQNSQEISSVQ